MHDGENLGQAVTDKLKRSKNKRIVNTFLSGVVPINLTIKVATHFSYGTRINNLHNICETKDSSIIKPFPSGVALNNLTMKVATRFSYGTRINNLRNICEIVYSPIIKTKVDVNDTHVAAQNRLMGSLLCLDKGPHIYQVQNRESIGDAVTVTDVSWQQFGEF